MTAANCPTCDREGCPTLQPTEHIEASRGDCPACVAFDDCYAHRVDWRARAIAAESRIAHVANELADELTTAQAEIDRAVASPGGMGATLPSSSRLRHGATPTVRAWLGRLVEKLRGGAAESDAARGDLLATVDRCGVCAQPTANQNHEPVGAGLPMEPTCDACLAPEHRPEVPDVR